MEKIHYVGVSLPVWVSFDHDPELILDWLLHVHQQMDGSYSRLTLEDSEAILMILRQISLEFDDGSTYDLTNAVLGESLIVNEDEAVVVGVVAPTAASMVRGVLMSFQEQDFEKFRMEGEDGLWEQWLSLREFYEATFRQDEIILVYYE